MTAFDNDGARKLDMSEWIEADYGALEPRRWGGERPFADGRFPTSDGRARLVLVSHEPVPEAGDFPFILNSGRYRDQWHTMTRTGLSPRLSQHRREPLVEVHPDDAAALQLADGSLARVETTAGASVFRVSLSQGQRRDELFVPIHWTDLTAGGGRTGLLMDTQEDPNSGQPGYKAVPARIAAVEPAWRGFLVAREAVADPQCLWWTKSAVPGGYLYELAGMEPERGLLEALLPQGARAEAIDTRRGATRVAVIDEDGRLAAALFTTREGRLPSRDWIVAELAAAEAASPIALLAGRPSTPQPDRGPIVCVCFDVGLKTIVGSIADQRLTSVAEVGEALRAGTNCGSCRPAIARLIEEAKEPAHVAG